VRKRGVFFQHGHGRKETRGGIEARGIPPKLCVARWAECVLRRTCSQRRDRACHLERRDDADHRTLSASAEAYSSDRSRSSITWSTRWPVLCNSAPARICNRQPGFAVTIVGACVLAACFIFSASNSSEASVCVML